MNKPEHHIERIVLDKETVDQLEEDMLIRRHIERYAYIRQFAYGKVLDAACGVGYGTYLVAKNPDVEQILGVDCDSKTIAFANDNYENEKISFQCSYFEEVKGNYDVLLSLETIEHLDDPMQLAELAERCNIKEIIVSYPMKKTTHYNKYHKWDFSHADMEYIFNSYQCINAVMNGDSEILHFIKRDRAGFKAKHYLSDR